MKFEYQVMVPNPPTAAKTRGPSLVPRLENKSLYPPDPVW